MKRKLYVFKSEYRNPPAMNYGQSMNVLTLVAVFESGMEAEAMRFVSGGSGIYHIWLGGEVDVEEAK